jgi:hypothetical protein
MYLFIYWEFQLFLKIKIISVKLDGVSGKNRPDNRISMNGYQPLFYSISGENGSK